MGNEKTEYKKTEFDYFINEFTGKYEEVKTKTGSRNRPIFQQRQIDFDDIENLDLDNRGQTVPYTSKHVLNFPQYMAYYWSPIIGDRACWLYLILLTYCNHYDFLWAKLSEIEYKLGGWSRPTLNKYLKVLEDNNFIIIVHRYNKEKNNGREDSPIIKVRQTVPLLSLEQYGELSKKDQLRHDEFMKQYGKNSIMDRFIYDSEQTIDELTQNSTLKISRKSQDKINKIMQEEKAMDYILTKLEYDKTVKTNELHEAILATENIVKPTFDQVFSESISVLNKEMNLVTVITSSLGVSILEFSKEKYILAILPALKSLYGEEIESVVFRSYEDYINMI